MGAGTAFLTGFVDAANQSRYEKRMAEHEQSIQDRADFTWKERDEEARARALEDQRTEREFRERTAATLAETQTDATALARTHAQEDQRIADEQATEQLTETLLALNPTYADNPEALARALTYGEDGLAMFTHRGSRYDPDGYLISSEDILDRDTEAFVRANAPISWRGNEDAWMLTEAAKEFGEMVRKEGGRSGRVAFNDARMRFEDTIGEDGVRTGARIVRPAAEGPEQYRLTAADNEDFITLKRQAYNSFNSIMKLTLDENNVPLTPGVYTSVVEGVTGLAAAAYSNAQTQRIAGTNPSLSFDTTFKAMFGKKHEDLRQLDDAHLAIGANAIAAYVADPTSLSNLPAAELLKIYENIRVRNKVTLNVPNVDLTEQRGTFVLNDILRNIEANPGFITEYGSDEQRAALAELTSTITPVVPAPAPPVAGGPGPAEPAAAFVDPDKLYSITNGISTTINTDGKVLYSYDNEEGQKKMNAAVEAFTAHIEEQKGKTIRQAIGSQRNLQWFIAKEFGLRKTYVGNYRQRAKANEKRTNAIAQLEEQWRRSMETR